MGLCGYELICHHSYILWSLIYHFIAIEDILLSYAYVYTVQVNCNNTVYKTCSPKGSLRADS